MAEDPPKVDVDIRYLQAIEETLLRHNRVPRLLSPAEFKLAREWQKAGIPLEVVLETMERVFANRRERKTSGTVNSLRYFEDAVSTAWAEVSSGRREVAQRASASTTGPFGARQRRVDVWVGSGVWEGWRLTTNHPASVGGQPVLITPNGDALGPANILRVAD